MEVEYHLILREHQQLHIRPDGVEEIRMRKSAVVAGAVVEAVKTRPIWREDG